MVIDKRKNYHSLCNAKNKKLKQVFFMKKTFIAIAAVAMMIAACSGNSNKKEKMSCCAGAYSPKTVLDSAQYLLDKQIKIKANVTHVCHCSGKKMVFTDIEDSTISIRVLAGGEIDKFYPCLVGQKANLTGYLRLNKITKEVLDNNEAKFAAALADATEKAKTDTSFLKKCDILKTRLENLKTSNQEKLQWMADNNTDFIPDYYIEAEKFADCCKKKNDPEANSQTAEAEGCGHHNGGSCGHQH